MVGFGVMLLPWVEVGPNTRLKLKTLLPSFFERSKSTSEPSSPTKSITLFASAIKEGLILQYTRILPELSFKKSLDHT